MEHPLDAAWRSFCDDVVNPKASGQDLIDMRNVFFVGAVSLWFEIVPLLMAATEHRVWTEEQAKRLAVINDELDQFTDLMTKRGKQ